MSNFELSIQITESDAQAIRESGFSVTIAKSINSTIGSSPFWLVLAPCETNTVNWDDDYGVYASSDQPGFMISASSTEYPVSPGVVFPFTNGAFDSPDGPALPPSGYGVLNNTGGTLTFGLLQRAIVNGKGSDANPVSAVAVASQGLELFQPSEAISVFLSQETSIVVIETAEAGLTLNMADNPTQSIHYNGSRFVLGPLG